MQVVECRANETEVYVRLANGRTFTRSVADILLLGATRGQRESRLRDAIVSWLGDGTAPEDVAVRVPLAGPVNITWFAAGAEARV